MARKIRDGGDFEAREDDILSDTNFCTAGVDVGSNDESDDQQQIDLGIIYRR